MRSVTSPTSLPFFITGKRRMFFSLSRWIASTMVAPPSMVMGLGVIQSRTLVFFGSISHPQVGLLHMVFREQLLPGSGEHHPPGLEDVGAVGDAQRLEDVLLHKQDGHPLPVELLDDVEDVPHE